MTPGIIGIRLADFFSLIRNSLEVFQLEDDMFISILEDSIHFAVVGMMVQDET